MADRPAGPPALTRAGKPRMRRLVATLFCADALALVVDGWTGSPHLFHYGIAWPLTVAFALVALVHGRAVIRSAGTAEQ